VKPLTPDGETGEVKPLAPKGEPSFLIYSIVIFPVGFVTLKVVISSPKNLLSIKKLSIIQLSVNFAP